MTLFTGIVLDGKVLPKTDFVLRDPNAWWAWDRPSDRPDLRARTGLIKLLAFHWTAGPSRFGEGAAARVVHAMKSRKRLDGSAMDVSAQFCVTSDGLVFQLADLRYATVHMGRGVNTSSIGVEQTWPGTLEQAQAIDKADERDGVDNNFNELPRDVFERKVRSNKVIVVAPDPRMFEASVRLANVLTDPEVMLASGGLLAITRTTSTGVGIPKAGACEHFQYPGTTKVDCAGLTLEALRGQGWA